MPPRGSTPAYWPSDYIDEKLAGRPYLTAEELGVAAFMAGSLRYILLSPELTRPLPRQRKPRLKPLSVLMHVTAKYDNFRLVYSHHCALLKEVNRLALSHFFHLDLRNSVPDR